MSRPGEGSVGIIGGGLVGPGHRAAPGQGRRRGDRLRARRAARRPGRDDRPRRDPRRPLLPRRPAHGRPRPRPGRGGGAGGRRLPLPPHRHRLLPGRPAGLDVLGARAADLPGAAAGRQGAPGRVRRRLPAQGLLRRPRGPRPGGVAAPALRRPAVGHAVAPAAGLEVRRPLRRPARDLPVGAQPADGRHARPLVARGHGDDRGRLPGARRPPRGRDPRRTAARS